MKNGIIRVLVVDDSALVRKILGTILDEDPGIEVVGAASNPYQAREKIKQLNPDVLTLDVEMPRMDGITFLRNLMRLRPMPVVMVSSLTANGANVTLEALEIGAVDFIQKPRSDVQRGLEEYGVVLKEKVKAAAAARVARAPSTASARRPVVSAKATGPATSYRSTDCIIAIGASTGGTEALREVLTRMPADSPGIVIAQHIPEAFSGPFAERMNRMSAVEVCEARDGQSIRRGHVYIAPGGKHLRVIKDGAHYRCGLGTDSPVNRHRPSVDVLFNSVAENVAGSAVGAILTGMGKDGAAGLLAMRRAGMPTMAQDERTSVIWGMPGAAVEMGGAEEVLPLGDIPQALADRAQERA